MKDEAKPSTWPGIESQLRDEAKRAAQDFPPFLHQRIMAAIRAEAEKQPRQTVGLSKLWRRIFAGGLACIVLALWPAPAPQPLADAPQKVSEWIVLVANSDEQMANLISNRVFNDIVKNPYQQQLDSLSNEFESALDFTLRMMPIELALR